MEQIISFFTSGDPRPLIYVWSGIFLIYFLVLLVQFIKLYKNHPELKRKQAALDPQIQDLVRQYRNKTMYAFCMMFIWAAGVMLIVCGFKLTDYNWVAVLIVLAAASLPLMGIKRKKK